MNDPGSARASDADREAMVERLRAGASDGRLTFDELTSRTGAVYQAKTRGELEAITVDLPERPASLPVVPSRRRSRIVSLFGDISRSGRWRAAGTIVPVAIFGDVEFDLRSAIVPAELEIRAIAPFGNVEVLVPEGVEVELTGFTVFGHKKIAVKDSGTGESAPVVRVRGFTIFGNVKVWSP